MFATKGGVGKSFTAGMLAEAMARLGLCALVIDADSQMNITEQAAPGFEDPESKNVKRGTLPQTLPHTLAGYMLDIPQNPKGAACATIKMPSAGPGAADMFIAPGSFRWTDIDFRMGVAYASALYLEGTIFYKLPLSVQLTAKSVNADVVIIDCNPWPAAYARNLMFCSDLLLLPCLPGRGSLRSIVDEALHFPGWADEKRDLMGRLSVTPPALMHKNPKIAGLVVRAPEGAEEAARELDEKAQERMCLLRRENAPESLRNMLFPDEVYEEVFGEKTAIAGTFPVVASLAAGRRPSPEEQEQINVHSMQLAERMLALAKHAGGK